MTTKKQRMYAQIEKHGNDLLNIFPYAAIKDPIKLCKRLHTLESKAHKAAEDYCNGVKYTGENDWVIFEEKMLFDLIDLLLPENSKALVVNSDPRGYALKLDDAYVRENNISIYRDWGGYGILAPEFTGDN